MKRKRSSHQWQLKKPDPEWLPGDERDITAAYVALAEKGKLYRFVSLRKHYEKLYLEWRATWDLLIPTGNAPWLDKFALQCHRQDKPFKKTLEGYISKLDRRRVSARDKMRVIERTLKEIEKSIPRPFHPDEGTRKTDMNRIPSPELMGTTEGAPGYRNFLIRRNAALSAEAICKRLDLELSLVRDEPPLGLPETWQKYGVKSYTDAYAHKKTTGLVQKLISEAKARL